MKKILLEFINYELKILHPSYSINDDFFESFNFQAYEDPKVLDIFYSAHSYYSFVRDENLLENFEKIYNSLQALFNKNDSKESSLIFELKIFKENDIFILTIFHFYSKNLTFFCVFYSLLIFKSLTIITLSHKTEKADFNKFLNSDTVISKTSDIFKNFIIFYSIDSMYELNNMSREIRSHFFSLFEYLSFIQVIEVKKIWIKNPKDGSIRSEKYWKLVNLLTMLDLDNFNINFSEMSIVSYKKKTYLVGSHYSQVCEIFRKNINSNLSFEYVDFGYINNIKRIEWNIDNIWFEKLINILEIKFLINFKELKKEIVSDLSTLELKFAWKNPELQAKISKNYNYLQVYKFYILVNKLKYKKIFIPFYFDFRGRMYYDSVISVTNCKILRTVYYSGYYKAYDYFKPIDEKYERLLLIYENQISEVKKLFNINDSYPKLSINILLLFISIGKFFIKKENVKIHLDEFVKLSLDYLKGNIEKELSIEDFLEIESYRNILLNYSDGKKRVVIKDFTASFFQHLTRLLGAKSIDTIELANMHDDLSWNDPYSFIIKHFLLSTPNLEFKKYMTRHYLKKPTMTIPYSIGFDSAWKYFIELISDENDLKNKTLKKEFGKYFLYAKKMLDSDVFFKNSTDRMILYAITKAHWLKKFEMKIESGSVHLTYYKLNKKVIDLILCIKGNKIRITKKINVVDNTKIDYEGIAISVRANWIAMMDAESLRKINKKLDFPIYSVHDSLLIDWLNNDSLVIICNEVLSDNNFPEISWDYSHDFKIFSFLIIL